MKENTASMDTALLVLIVFPGPRENDEKEAASPIYNKAEAEHIAVNQNLKIDGNRTNSARIAPPSNAKPVKTAP